MVEPEPGTLIFKQQHCPTCQLLTWHLLRHDGKWVCLTCWLNQIKELEE